MTLNILHARVLGKDVGVGQKSEIEKRERVVEVHPRVGKIEQQIHLKPDSPAATL